MKIEESLVKKLSEWLGDDGLHFFRTLYKLTGSYIPVLKLNYEKKGVPAHPVHFREGVSVRNFLREQNECGNWSFEEIENNYALVIREAVLYSEKNNDN